MAGEVPELFTGEIEDRHVVTRLSQRLALVRFWSISG